MSSIYGKKTNGENAFIHDKQEGRGIEVDTDKLNQVLIDSQNRQNHLKLAPAGI